MGATTKDQDNNETVSTAVNSTNLAEPVSPLPTFPRFQELPFELRMAVWEHFLPPPRHIKFHCEKAHNPVNKRRFAKSFTPNQPLPILLQISHETRDFILNSYQPHFQTEHSPVYTYVSFKQDTVSFEDGVLNHLKRKELDGIEKLELAVQDAAYFAHYNLEILKGMKSLKELILQDQMEGRIIAAWDTRTWNTRVAADFEEAMALDPGGQEGRTVMSSHPLSLPAEWLASCWSTITPVLDTKTWECPRVWIMNGEEELVTLEGGASIPGWVPEDAEEPLVVRSSTYDPGNI